MARYLSLLVVMPVLWSTVVMAEEEQAAPEPLTYSQKAHLVAAKFKPVSTYVGVGLFSDMLNVNAETVTDLGNFYLRVGKFMESNAGAAFNMGWRHPVTGGRDESGYFVGAFLGQVIASTRNNDDYHRNGVGFDISYQWVNEHTRKTVSVGLGSGFNSRLEGNANESSGPRAFFSFSTALKVF